MSLDNTPKNLIKMINQIGINLRAEGELDEVAQQVASHLKRFWSASMIFKVSKYAEEDGEALTEVSMAAIAKLAD